MLLRPTVTLRGNKDFLPPMLPDCLGSVPAISGEVHGVFHGLKLQEIFPNASPDAAVFSQSLALTVSSFLETLWPFR